MRNQNGLQGQGNVAQNTQIRLDFMIRHVRLQIKSVISELMNDLANYKRYLKTL